MFRDWRKHLTDFGTKWLGMEIRGVFQGEAVGEASGFGLNGPWGLFLDWVTGWFGRGLGLARTMR